MDESNVAIRFPTGTIKSGILFCAATYRLFVEISRSHSDTHTHPVEPLFTSDHPAAETATYTTHNEYVRRTCMPSAGFDPAIPAIERLQTCVLDRTVTEIG